MNRKWLCSEVQIIQMKYPPLCPLEHFVYVPHAQEQRNVYFIKFLNKRTLEKVFQNAGILQSFFTTLLCKLHWSFVILIKFVWIDEDHFNVLGRRSEWTSAESPNWYSL